MHINHPYIISCRRLHKPLAQGNIITYTHLILCLFNFLSLCWSWFDSILFFSWFSWIFLNFEGKDWIFWWFIVVLVCFLEFSWIVKVKIGSLGFFSGFVLFSWILKVTIESFVGFYWIWLGFCRLLRGFVVFGRDWIYKLNCILPSWKVCSNQWISIKILTLSDFMCSNFWVLVDFHVFYVLNLAGFFATIFHVGRMRICCMYGYVFFAEFCFLKYYTSLLLL